MSDSFQATIGRVPRGGGEPQIWFQDSRLDMQVGPNGMRIDEKGEKLYFAASLDSQGHGFILTLPLVDQPSAADLSIFHEHTAGEIPDGIAFGKSGLLYVALAGTSQISVLSPQGAEQSRYSGPAFDPANPAQPLQWANPAGIAFNDKARSLLVTNHAIFAPIPDGLFAVMDVYVNDKAAHLAEPHLAKRGDASSEDASDSATGGGPRLRH